MIRKVFSLDSLKAQDARPFSLFFFFFFFFVLCLLGLHLRHTEVPKLGVQSEL